MRLLMFALFLAVPLHAQTVAEFADPDRAEKVAATESAVDQIFRVYAERQHLPGFVYGVVVDGNLVYSSGFGLANLEEQIPADPRSLFRIASMSKSFTAVSILQLRDAGKLGLDDPVSEYLPEVKTLTHLTTDAPEITIRHLLTHSAGFPDNQCTSGYIPGLERDFKVAVQFDLGHAIPQVPAPVGHDPQPVALVPEGVQNVHHLRVGAYDARLLETRLDGVDVDLQRVALGCQAKLAEQALRQDYLGFAVILQRRRKSLSSRIAVVRAPHNLGRSIDLVD